MARALAHDEAVGEGVAVVDRRGMVKASLAGIAGLSVPQLLQAREAAAQQGRGRGDGKSVILLWMAGGPSHIDTWDPKPDRPIENRGPFKTIQTKLPGVRICEFLPKQAAMLDRSNVRFIEVADSSGRQRRLYLRIPLLGGTDDTKYTCDHECHNDDTREPA